MKYQRLRTPPRSIEERKAQDFLNWKDLALFGITFHRRHLVRLIQAGKFPQPVKLGEKRVAFVREQIVAWCEARKSDTVQYKGAK